VILPLLSSDSPLVFFLFLLCFFFCFFAMVDSGLRWLCCGLQTVALRWLLCSWSVLLFFFPGSLCLSPSLFLAIIVPLTSFFFMFSFSFPPISNFFVFFLCSLSFVSFLFFFVFLLGGIYRGKREQDRPYPCPIVAHGEWGLPALSRC